MILAVGKSAAFVVDFSKPGGSSTVAPLASVERSVAAGATAFCVVADESVDVEALEDLLHALLDSATHKKALGKTSDKAPRKPRLRLEKTDCMGVSISKGSLERGVRAIEPVVTNTAGVTNRSLQQRSADHSPSVLRIEVQSERVVESGVDVDAAR
jgi:hypothetical protein